MPDGNYLKCNIGVSWISCRRNCGVSWIARDNAGVSLLHGRRSFSEIPSDFEAELLGFVWDVESFRVFSYPRIIFESSSQRAIEAIMSPHQAPGFRQIINNIKYTLQSFIDWKLVSVLDAMEIAISVTKDHHYQSYISRDGPFWLSDLLLSEKA